ncbi:MAG: ABC transporter permease [Thioploca sp.]|nr:ABC transporter permease [Thioploca sp.]
MKWLVFAFRNLFRNRRRTLVTLLITATGTAAILSSSGFALYTYHSLKELSANDTGHLILARPDYFQRDEDTPLALGLSDYTSIQQQLSQDPRVQVVLPRIALTGLISNGDKSVIFAGSGIDPQELRVKVGVVKLLEGQPLSEHPHNQTDAEVMLAKDLAKNLQAQVGTGLTLLATTSEGALNALDVQVQGIFSTGVPELDQRLILLHYPSAQTLLASQRVSTLAVYLHDINLTKAFAAQVHQTYPQLGVQTWLDQAALYLKVRGLYDRIFGTLGLILVIIVFLSVFNTLSMTVTERTREIGTLAALGTYHGEILRIFMLEALIIGLLSNLLGVIGAWLTSVAVQFIDLQMPAPPGRSEGYPFLIHFSPELSLYVVLVITLVCVIAAWLAARRGVNKTIVEALADV